MIADDRGRIPFAVIAILLLVSSATVATTVGQAPPPEEPSVDVVTERTEAEQQTALRRAVRTAATDAANAPVVRPANTSVGRVLGENETFRNSVRLRVYVAAREQLDAIERRRGDVVATASLPAIDDSDPASVRNAIARVELEAAGDNATAVTVRLNNVTTNVRRGDRVLDESRSSPRVTVATPILALHDRVTAYEERLNAGVTRPGLEQRLTAVLNGAGWARGYAQYGGAPIGNVISNGHVEVATNAALLDVQRSTIGEVDRAGVRGLERGVGKLALQDFLSLSPDSSPYLEQVLDRQSVVPENDLEGLDVPARDEPMTVGVNRTAEDIFLLMVSDEDHGGGFVPFREELQLDAVIEDTYAADVRVSGTVLSQSGGPPADPSPPGAGWNRVGSTLDESIDVSSAAAADSIDASGYTHPLETYSRRVVTDYELVTTWEKGTDRKRTRSSSREETTVQVTVEGTHTPDVPGPDREIGGVHDRGAGPLDGPNLAGVERVATERLLEDRGGRDAVAKRAATGELDTDPISVVGDRPDGLREWLYRDLRELREEVRDVTVAVDRRDVGSFAANPPALLAEKLRDRREALLDAPSTYDGVADRARVAARAKYLDLVSRALEERASGRETRRDELGDALDDADAGPVDDVQRSVHATVADPDAKKPALDGPGGPVHLRVDAAPAYLEPGSAGESAVPAVDGGTTLTTRNVNVFSLPYGEAINGLLEAVVSGPERTSLGTAARTLRSSEAVGADDRTSHHGVSLTLEDVVERRITTVEADVEATLADHDVGTDRSDREAIVEAGLAKWDETSERAIAISNGSAATAILEAADERAALSTLDRDRLALELDRAIRGALEEDDAQPQSQFVEDVGEAVKSETASAIRDAVSEYQDDALEKLTKGKLSTLPSGLPLTPVPGYWYATTNIWHVEVEGEYARFGVRATRGRPSDPGAGLMYARDGGNVSLDVDGDGDAERLGTSRRVQFSATVDVVVVVPPGAQGVGDVSGDRDERSAGWPLHEE